MEEYKLYWVGQAKVKPGKHAEATAWWREKGAPGILADPWTKSLKCFAIQFGLGGEWSIEIWQEIGSYGSFDQMDKDIFDNPDKSKKKQSMWDEANEYFEWGPTRLMGDWPESEI
jgi:hypothetical protein